MGRARGSKTAKSLFEHVEKIENIFFDTIGGILIH
jgi:hypothetical protein